MATSQLCPRIADGVSCPGWYVRLAYVFFWHVRDKYEESYFSSSHMNYRSNTVNFYVFIYTVAVLLPLANFTILTLLCYWLITWVPTRCPWVAGICTARFPRLFTVTWSPWTWCWIWVWTSRHPDGDIQREILGPTGWAVCDWSVGYKIEWSPMVMMQDVDGIKYVQIIDSNLFKWDPIFQKLFQVTLKIGMGWSQYFFCMFPRCHQQLERSVWRL